MKLSKIVNPKTKITKVHAKISSQQNKNQIYKLPKSQTTTITNLKHLQQNRKSNIFVEYSKILHLYIQK